MICVSLLLEEQFRPKTMLFCKEKCKEFVKFTHYSEGKNEKPQNEPVFTKETVSAMSQIWDNNINSWDIYGFQQCFLGHSYKVLKSELTVIMNRFQ